MPPKQQNHTQSLLNEASSLLLVTALCSAGGALTTTASAAVVSTPGISPSTPLVIPNNIDGVYINVIDGSNGVAPPAGWDLNPYSASAGNLNWWGATTTTWLSPAGSTGANIALPVGAVVDATGTFVRTGGSASATAGAGTGQFTLNATNFVGFQFTNEANGLTHFGYLSILLGSDFSQRSITGSFFEDTAGTGITVGAVPVPEPAGAFLAAGAAGLMALRRRRQVA